MSEHLNTMVATIGYWYYPQYQTEEGWFFFYDEEGKIISFARLDPAWLYLVNLEKESK